MREQNFSFAQVKPVKVHPIRAGRKVPLKQLRKKLNVEVYERATPFVEDSPSPKVVKILLKQHTGAPANSTVAVGDKVSRGEQIGKMEEGKLGANIHSSIDGVVTEVNTEYVVIKK